MACLAKSLGMLQLLLRAEVASWKADGIGGMQKYPQQLSVFFEDQHWAQRVQSAGNMMCSGNL